jgi:hypothetical protein
MAANNRPSLDILVPLVMIDDNLENENNDNLSCGSQKGLKKIFFLIRQIDLF